MDDTKLADSIPETAQPASCKAEAGENEMTTIEMNAAVHRLVESFEGIDVFSDDLFADAFITMKPVVRSRPLDNKYLIIDLAAEEHYLAEGLSPKRAENWAVKPQNVFFDSEAEAQRCLSLATEEYKQKKERKPTQDELIVLVKNWAKEAIRDEWDRFNGCSYGRKDLLWTDEKWNRVGEIAEVLGEDLTEQAVEEAYQEESQECDRYTWIVFRYGT